jgi:hypothetical protein
MSFNRKTIPPLAEFKKRLEETPKLLEYLMKADSVSGPTESMEYLDRLLKDFQEKQTKENIQSHPE